MLRTTRGFFHTKYWNRHGRQGFWWPHPEARERVYAVNYSEKDLNIAVHVRRGDFFSERKRKMLKDSTYAKIIADVLDMVEEESGPFSRVRPVVHIYSEGRKVYQGGFLHDTSHMDRLYYDENGIPHTEDHWRKLLDRYAKHLSGHRWPSKVEVVMHISGDTLTDLHNMITADIFVGSESAMSVGLVRSLSRGVTVLPGFPDHDDYECCSTRFSSNEGILYSRGQFLRKWRAYEAANGASLLRSLGEI